MAPTNLLIQSADALLDAETTPTARTLGEEEVRTRAYHIYESHQGVTSNPTLDWLEAERQLRAES
jgi:hypothetical protein